MSVIPTADELLARANAKIADADKLELQAHERRREAAQLRRDAEAKRMEEAAKLPVDRSCRVLLGGGKEEDRPDYRDLKPNGQQKDYVVLCDDERAKGFVRPVRRSYVHEKCGTRTTMSQSIAETYARDPAFYSGTFCCGCGSHYPVGEKGEFIWEDGSKVGT